MTRLAPHRSSRCSGPQRLDPCDRDHVKAGLDSQVRKTRPWLGAAIVALAAPMIVSGAFGVSGSDTITTIAGNGTPGFSGDGGRATLARLNKPWWVAVDNERNVYIADWANNRVRKVNAAGNITTFAGTGEAGFSGDGGPATRARLNAPWGVAVDGRGNVYITDLYNYRVRKVNPGGTITTFAGTGAPGFSGDGGPATSAQLTLPYGIAVDRSGNVYIADHANMRVRKVSPQGTITTFAGTGRRGFSGDGGPATRAKLNWPYGVAVDGKRNVYIADYYNNRVRKVSASGRVTTFAGRGPSGPTGRFSGDGGPATSARLNKPAGVAVDLQGNVYIVDRNNDRVRKVSPGGTITTIAGTGRLGFSGDGGPARTAQLLGPFGVAVDAQGNVYIADTGNNRVRRIGIAAPTTPTRSWNPRRMATPATHSGRGYETACRDARCTRQGVPGGDVVYGTNFRTVTGLVLLRLEPFPNWPNQL